MFDRFDDAGRGSLPAAKIRRCFDYMGCDVSTNAAAAQWVRQAELRAEAVNFPDFAMAYSAAYAHIDPDVMLSNGEDGEDTGAESGRARTKKDHHSPRQTHRSKSPPARNAGVERTKSGHVRTRAKQTNGHTHSDGWAQDTDADEGADNASSGSDRGADADNAEDGSAPLFSVAKLADVKRVFDRFAVQDLMTAAEAVQGLTEAGCAAPRAAIGR